MENQNEPQGMAGLRPGFFSQLKAFLIREKITIIVILIMSAISFGATGYLLTTNIKPPASQKRPQETVTLIPSISPSPQPIISDAPTATPTPILAADETATWSAFNSADYSYSIKYPQGWTAQITASADPKILEYVVFNPVATKAGTLSITLSYGTRTYSEALKLDPQIGTPILVASASSTQKNSKDSNGYQSTNVIVPFGLNTIIFNAKAAYTDLFNQMLTTLKLTK